MKTSSKSQKKPTRKTKSPLPGQAKKRALPRGDRYILRLFVAGASIRSHQAILRVRALCDGQLKGRVKLEVIDIYQQPGLARTNEIVATPTLIIVFPPPLRRFIGNLVNIADLFLEIDTGAVGHLFP